LAAHTIGGVVAPAQTLMTVVPEGSRLEVEAMLPNRDVGFVHVGQPAEIKVEAFTYTRYGPLHGQVDDVSRINRAESGQRRIEQAAWRRYIDVARRSGRDFRGFELRRARFAG